MTDIVDLSWLARDERDAAAERRARAAAEPFTALLKLIADSARPEVSPTLQRHDARAALKWANPVLAALYRIEAVGSGRCDNDQGAFAQLALIACEARDAIEHLTGSRENLFFPFEGRDR